MSACTVSADRTKPVVDFANNGTAWNVLASVVNAVQNERRDRKVLNHNHIEITARDNGQILVERKIAGVVTDRYHTHDLTKPIKRTDTWIRQTQQLLSQPSANVVIEMPVMPTIEMSQAEKLAEVENVLEFHRTVRSSQAAMIKELRREKMASGGFVEAPKTEVVGMTCCGIDPSHLHNGRTVEDLMQLANKVAARAE